MTNPAPAYPPFPTALSGRPRRSGDTASEVVLVARFGIEPGQAAQLAADLAEALRAVPGLASLDIDLPARPALHLVPPNRPLRIHVPSRTVWLRDTELGLTRKEFDLLLQLARYPRQVFTRPMLLSSVWGISDNGRSRTIDVHIRRLRALLGPNLHLITTVRGVGYRWEDTGELSIEE